MTCKMPYVQPWKGSFRFRRRVPDHVAKVIGKQIWLKTLNTASRAEANRLVISHIAETDQIIKDAEEGNWPRLTDAQLESLTEEWFRWFLEKRAERLGFGKDRAIFMFSTQKAADWALTGDEELTDTIKKFIDEKMLEIRVGSRIFNEFSRKCKIAHHVQTKSYVGDIADQWEAEKIVLEAIDEQKITYQQIAQWFQRKGGPDGRPAAPPCQFSVLIDDWACEKNVSDKSKYGFERIVNKFTNHIGHDDAEQVTDSDVIAWKDHLVASCLHPKTIKNHLMVLKTLYNYAKINQRVSMNPATNVVYKANVDRRTERIPYTDEDARRILLAARDRTDHLRWVPWIAAFTGARLEEICGAMVADIETIDGHPCLHIRLEYREAGSSLKNENSQRVVPLHGALIAEGFLTYVKGLPSAGPLFPNLTPDRFGKRAGTATKKISRWVRREVGIADSRKAPSHSWRHWFKTQCRKAGIPEEVHDALTGHSGGGVGRDYGSYGPDVLVDAINRIRSPLAEPLQAQKQEPQ